MAISGTLTADFTSFFDACKQAEVTLSGFESNAGKVGGSLDKMSNSLNGTSLIQNATVMAEAVDRVGGVSKLTEAELQRVSAQAQEAAAKLTAMGKDVPPGIQAIADAGTHVKSGLNDMLPSISDVAAAFGLAFSVQSALSFLSTITDEAHSLQILSLQTQINVEDLQVLGAATKEYGVTSAELGKAIYQLGQRIAGGDASVVSGLALMGLSLKDVEGLHGEELFLKVEEAAGKLHGTIRDTAMSDLYGAKLGSSLGALSSKMSESMEKAQQLNTIMGTDAVKAAADYADTVERATKNLHAMAVEMIGPALGGLNVIAEAVQKGGSKWDIANGIVHDFFWQSTSGAGGLADVLDKLNQKTAENTKKTGDQAGAHHAVVVALTDEEQHRRFLQTLVANADVQLTATQLRDLEALKAIGELNAKNAAGVGVNAAQFAAYTASVAAAADGLRILGEVENEANAAALTGYTTRVAGLAALAKASIAAYSTDAQIAALQQLDAAEQVEAVNAEHASTSEADRAKIRNDAAKTHQALMTEITAIRQKEMTLVNAGVIEASLSQTAYNKTLGLDASGAVLLQTTALDTLNARMIVIAAMHTTDAAKATLVDAANRAYTNTLHDEAVAQDNANNALSKVPALAAGAAQSYWALVDAAAAAAAAAAGIDFASVGTRAPSLTDPGFSSGSTLGGGLHPLDLHRASGGPVSAGTSYTVGEKGPELFTPGASGFITPNGGGASAVTVNVTIAALTPGDARVSESIRQVVEKAITDTLRNRVHLGSA